VGGYLFYHFQEQQMRQRIESGLSIVAQLKVAQIAEWRAERLMDADMLVGSPFFTEGVERYLASPTDTETKDKILARLAVIEKAYPYQDILLADVNGSVLLSLNDSVNRLSDMTISQLPVAISEHKAVMVDFHFSPDSNYPQLDVIAPLFPWGQDSQQPIGAVVFCIDPSQYLYPLVQSWPIPSETAETLLVERDGDQVLYLNELRHQKDTALKLKIPLSRQEVPAVMAVLGKEEIVEGKDYRGVEVLAALRHIPDSPWYMVAKIDTSEALSPWRSRSGLTIALVAILLAAALAFIGLIWQRRQRLAYQALYQAEAGRKKLEQDLVNSEVKYRRLFESAQDAILILDGETGQITDANPFIKDMLGYTLTELLGKHLWEIGAFRDIVASKAAFEELKQKGYIRYDHLLLQNKDGRQIHVEFVSNKYKVDHREVFQCNIRNITERKLAEETLRQSEEKYRTVLNEIYEVYYELDLAGNYTFFNDALCRQTGYSRKELMGMNYRRYTPEEDVYFVYERFNRVYRTGQPMRWVPLRTITKDGGIIYTEDTVLPLRNEKGEVIGFRGLGRDVTERKLAEEERRQLELKAQITSRLASVGEMAAGVAHEINNPLTGVTGYAQLLIDRKDIPEDIRSDLAAINDGAQRVAGIVQRLLAFSRQTRPQRKLVDINELIEGTLVLRAYHLRVNNIEVVTRLARGFLETVADPGQIQQVLLNLIVNAETEMKLAHGKGKLTITTKKKDKTIKIYIKDNGPGIKPEVMDKIFDPFFTTREVGQGTGLGLSLCYGIVTEHRGKIYAESKPGKGATFIVELPVVTKVAPPEPAKPVVKKSHRAAKARILVVDDEPVIRNIVSRVLSGEGHKVDTADNAADALKKIETKRYSLILLDIKMPGMDGVELYKRIQKVRKSLTRRVVFITGDAMGADTEKFLAEIKSAHIEKPFDAEQLKKAVKRALSEG
ncbi:MAG: PAS domain S-box protein, partial [Dehalococcoidia bacterium]|nr:PAS domain S-box protein [Dehalococcoidia bacterium]